MKMETDRYVSNVSEGIGYVRKLVLIYNQEMAMVAALPPKTIFRTNSHGIIVELHLSRQNRC